MSNLNSLSEKTILLNHIKKHYLCSDSLVIKSLSDLTTLAQNLKINLSDYQNSKRELEDFQAQHNILSSCFGDEDYPSAFYHLNSPPSIFYYSGDSELINKNYNLAIVGTRNSSLYGEHCCRTVVESLAEYRVSFISGLARGIDLTAHKTALKSKQKSIAIIGSGLLRFTYPGEQKTYFEELKKHHLVISEFHPQEHASSRSFALRNRLIAALSNSCIVIEAPKTSGALITAEHSLKMQRDLYAIPGDLNKRSFAGSNKLLADYKAQPIYQASRSPEILGLTNTDTNYSLKKNIKKALEKTKVNNPLIDLLDSGINDFDLLLIKSDYSSATELVKDLGDLEIQGKVSRRGALFITN